MHVHPLTCGLTTAWWETQGCNGAQGDIPCDQQRWNAVHDGEPPARERCALGRRHGVLRTRQTGILRAEEPGSNLWTHCQLPSCQILRRRDLSQHQPGRQDDCHFSAAPLWGSRVRDPDPDPDPVTSSSTPLVSHSSAFTTTTWMGGASLANHSVLLLPFLVHLVHGETGTLVQPSVVA